MSKTKLGTLTVVGTGINALAQCSLETKSFIEHADVVYALVTDSLTLSWLHDINKNVINLQTFYQLKSTDESTSNDENDVKRPRSETYIAIKDTLCDAVKSGKNVVAVFYGHPGVFVFPSHAAVKELRAEGYSAQMLPGISAEDCLFADLNIDPCTAGCVQHEATAFLFYELQIDTSAGLILWQPGVLGDHTLLKLRPMKEAITALKEKLLLLYPKDHQLVIYEAADFPLAAPRMEWITLGDLHNARFSLASTVYIPPSRKPRLDMTALRKLALTPEQIHTHAPTNN